MRFTGQFIFLLLTHAFVALTANPADAVPRTEQTITCNMKSIQATFTAARSTYHVTAQCNLEGKKYDGNTTWILRDQWGWDSTGLYDPHSGLASESVLISDWRGSATFATTLTCPSDPWLGPSLGSGKVPCANPNYSYSGKVLEQSDMLKHLLTGFLYGERQLVGEISLPNSTGFQYNRADLIAQRDAELKTQADAAAAAAAAAEAARLKEERRLQKSIQPAPTLLENLAPFVISPAANSLFLSMTAVPIKLAPPPRRMTVTAYMVRIERKDVGNSWSFVTNLPVGAAEVSSPSGYLGWGAPGPGRGAAMIAGPGTYRVSAQVSAPQPTAWSLPVEFVVTAPSKAIQRAPKMFGQ